MTLFGEGLDDRVKRLQEVEDRTTDDHRESKEDTLKSFLPSSEAMHQYKLQTQATCKPTDYSILEEAKEKLESVTKQLNQNA